jgi:hypothetical protein
MGNGARLDKRQMSVEQDTSVEAEITTYAIWVWACQLLFEDRST